ncbi:MAG: radical SAM family heme chaperone HemW [Polyangiales bacterium]
MRAAVYVHVPWCLQRCPYCDFATEAVQPAKIPHAAYAAAVTRELQLRAEALGGPLEPISLFFGGGTPSLWSHESLGAVIAAVTRWGSVGEVTVECNPTSLDRDRASSLRDRGVTRVSLGVQSLRDRHLRYLGRLHDAAGALAALRGAVAAGGLRVTADVMFGLHEQSRDELVDDVRALVGEGADHLSCYALTIEPATRFGELARKGRLPRLPDDEVASLYEAIESTLDRECLAHYEVSNYARPGQRSEHNLAYWRGEAYLGLGAGAVGAVPRVDDVRHAVRWRNDHDVPAYLAALERGELPPGETESLDPETRAREALMLGLRTDEGVDVARTEARTGRPLRAGRERAIARQAAAGNVVDDGATLRIPRDRWLVADGIVASLF